MFIRFFVAGLAFSMLSGQVLSAESNPYRNQVDGRSNASQQAASETRIPTPSEMERLSRAEIKKKLDEMEAERKRGSDR